MIPCSRISVNCVLNDPVEVLCGGPEFLGFDFAVREEETTDLQNVILMALESNEVPVIRLNVGKTRATESSLWSSEQIIKEIEHEAEYLKEEANRVSFHPYSLMK